MARHNALKYVIIAFVAGVGRVRMRLTQPVFADPYSRNRLTGGMILIDEATNTTVGTVMITDAR